MRKLYENFHIFHFQKRIVSAETIRGNTVLKPGKLLYFIKVSKIAKFQSKFVKNYQNLPVFVFQLLTFFPTSIFKKLYFLN